MKTEKITWIFLFIHEPAKIKSPQSSQRTQSTAAIIFAFFAFFAVKFLCYPTGEWKTNINKKSPNHCNDNLASIYYHIVLKKSLSPFKLQQIQIRSWRLPFTLCKFRIAPVA